MSMFLLKKSMNFLEMDKSKNREARPVIFICIREKWEMPSAGKKIHRAIREKKFKKKKLE